MTGSIWDLLILPSCYQPETAPRRVLVLGVGGGAVILQLQELFNPELIIGVEMDPLHLDIARRFFGLGSDNVKLIRSDAVSWLRDACDQKFDLIIEDMFTEAGRRPVRAVPADNAWLKTLVKHLSPRGILVMNFASTAEFRDSAIYREMPVRNFFSAIYQLTLPSLDNLVIAMHRHPVLHTAMHGNIMNMPVLRRAVLTKKLRYRSRKLRQLKQG